MAHTDDALALCRPEALLEPEFPTARYDRVREIRLAPGALLAAAPDAGTDPGCRFVVLWTEATRLWRLRQFKDFCTTVDEMAGVVEAMAPGEIRDVAAAYHCTMEAQKRDSQGALPQAQQAAETAVTTAEALRSAVRNGPLPGAYNMFAEIVASREEEIEAEGSAFGHSVPADIDMATSRIGDAIRLRPTYAKYHATQARLESLQGRGRDAMASIQTAMELESPTGADRATRMLEYTAIRERIRMRGQFRRAMTAAEEAARELQHSQGQMIAVVSLLAGVVALVVAGGSAGSSAPDSEQAATVVLALTLGIGWLIVLVGAIVARTPAWRTIITAVLFGAGMAGMALLVKEVIF